VPWLQQLKLSAVKQCHSGKSFGVPRAILQNHLSSKTEFGAGPEHPTYLPFEQEEKVVNYACSRASLGIGFG